MKLFRRCAAKAALALSVRIVVFRDAVGQENTLREAPSSAPRQRLSLPVAVGHLDKDMPLVFGMDVIAVDNADRIVHLQAVFESQPGTREQLQHPAVRDLSADPGRDQNGLVRDKRKCLRGKEVISSRTYGRAARQPDPLVNLFCENRRISTIFSRQPREGKCDFEPWLCVFETYRTAMGANNLLHQHKPQPM